MFGNKRNRMSRAGRCLLFLSCSCSCAKYRQQQKLALTLQSMKLLKLLYEYKTSFDGVSSILVPTNTDADLERETWSAPGGEFNSI